MPSTWGEGDEASGASGASDAPGPLPAGDGREPASADDGDAEREALGEDELAVLRKLLLGPETERLAELEEQVQHWEVRAEDVAAVLPGSIVARSADDAELASALAPLVESSIETSVRRNPEPLTDAIFPVIGPAIRKAIASALSNMVESFNTALENSLSPRSLRWRWEARRTGVPFSEIVLLHSLVYRVERVFLIHRVTGTLLHEAAAPAAAGQDADLVSGMLSAIQDFVHDSIESGAEGELKQVEVGGFTLEIAQGPLARLAAVVRGTPPPSLREELVLAIERVHAEQAEALSDFDGDVAPFEPLHALLEGLLVQQLQERDRTPSPARRRFLRTAGVVALAALLVWAVREVILRHEAGVRWQETVAALRAEPGYLLVSADRVDDGYRIEGFRDPLAREPADVIGPRGVDRSALRLRLEPYHSIEEPLLSRRVLARLEPPETVRVELEGDAVLLSGSAPRAWIDGARARAAGLPGIRAVDARGLRDLDLEELERRIRDLDGRELGPATSELAERVGALAEAADRARRLVSVVVFHRPGPGAEPGAAEERVAEACAVLEAAAGPHLVWSVSTLPTAAGGASSGSATLSATLLGTAAPDRWVP